MGDRLRPVATAATVGALLVIALLGSTVAAGAEQRATAAAAGRQLVTLATVPVGIAPTSIAVDPSTGRAYVTSQGDDTLTVLDGRKRRVVATIRVGGRPTALTVDPALHEVFVGNYGSRDVSVINATTNRLVATIATGNRVACMAADTLHHLIYLAGDTTDQFRNPNGVVQVIDSRDDRLLATVPIGGPGSALVDVSVDPGSPAVYVAYGLRSNPPLIAMLDAVTLQQRAAYPGLHGVFGDLGALGMTVDQSTHRVLLSSPDFSPGLVVFDGTSPRSFERGPITVQVGSRPEGVAVDPSTQIAYVANSGDHWPDAPNKDSVSVVDEKAARVIAAVPVGHLPWGVAVDPTTHLVFVANQGSNTVSIIAGLTELRVAAISVCTWGKGAHATAALG
jgi:YVTN family beta-propeller protein